MMGLRSLRRSRTIFLAFGLLSLTLYMLLNFLSEEFSVKGEKSDYQNLLGDVTVENKQAGLNKYRAGIVAQPQRKPKTMDFAESEELSSTVQFKPYKRSNFKIKYIRKEIENDKSKENQPQKENHMPGYHEFHEREDKINTQDQDDYTAEENDDNYEDVDEKGDEEDDDDYDYDAETATNAPFKPGDFGDIRGLEFYQKPKLKYSEVSSDTGRQQNKEKTEVSGQALVQSGIFWTDYVESLIPKGLSYANVTNMVQMWRKQVVRTLEKPSWDRCGRPQNGYAILQDGTRMCVRYRQPHSSYVYGEALSFYLSRLLQMDNVPAVVLAQTSSTSQQWRAVNISSLDWKENKTIAFIQWIDNINSGTSSRAYIPPIILQAYRIGMPITSHVISKSLLFRRNPALIAEVVQWGTMIVFDYLTGNYDRIASMQDAEDKEKNPTIMEEPIRNLRKSSQDGKLWLIDNESGLLDAYELLEPYLRKSQFSTFHRQMLETMCVFQSSLVSSVLKLSEHSSPHQRLLNFAGSFEPLIYNLPKEEHFKLFVEMFDQRLADVVNWIKYCQTLDAG